ncbi:tetratricopeptide repeat protein [Sodalinema gerasimenkoae]|uniref:tetratricopeptide repeat protein n=1 Tax=Sodalinema gerasimenkoae TaxID=2862348 RepID=UPI0013572F54|nr:tetratricopeptide repeat protein [Sodalinema gerasimenkoae]
MSDSLTAEKALEFVEDLLVRQSGRRLSEDEKAIFRGSWENLTYDQIRGKFDIYTHIVDFRRAGGRLWNTIADLFELPRERVTKYTFPGFVEQQWKLRQQTSPPLIESPEAESFQPNQLTSEGFVGREQAIADLDGLRAAGATCILIQSPGGVGKTVLAERYLSQRFDRPILRFDLGKETQNISSAEGLIEQKLRDLGEEPGREFMVSCDRLRSKLQAEALPVLVDNLEPALDENGRLIETHRSYVELFRVLSDASSKSLTLITSRERVRESLNINLYPLEHLSLEAWQEYLNQTNLRSDTPVLVEIHQAYRGNALAMKVLRERITLDYEGQIEEYWKAHQTEDGVSVETDIENLISEQFERLATVHPMAYRLLCRMGCFRYQDVPTVPREGLLCLLWELPAKHKVKMIEALCDRALVERVDGEYKLHPLIRDEAVERLRSSEDWERANQVAAEFWTAQVGSVENVNDARIAIESYHHYINIGSYLDAGTVITNERNSSAELGEALGDAWYRLGLLKPMSDYIQQVISKIPNCYTLVKSYNILGDIEWLRGNLSLSIRYHEMTKKLSGEVLSNQLLDSKDLIKCSRIFANSRFNMSLSEIDRLEIQKAKELLLESKELYSTHLCIYQFYEDFQTLSPRNKSKGYVITLPLAFCEAKLGNLVDAKNYLSNFKVSLLDATSWDIGYGIIFMALTYKELGDYKKSEQKYKDAINFSGPINYSQVQAKALTGLAEIYRLEGDYTKANSSHHKSIEILQKIGAKCDLAEAYYQLALTYQAMDDRQNSQLYFQKALTLWERIDAPKQIERVRQSMESGRISDSGG